MADDDSPAVEPTAEPTGEIQVLDPTEARWEGDVVLSDGGTMHVRPIRHDDGDRIARFHERQSPESIYFRYFSPRPRLSTADIERLTRVDGIDRMAFVGLINDELVGVARYDRYPSRQVAEVAFFTDDDHAGRGMATVMLEYLAAAARDVGITGFSAQVLPTNRRMQGVFKQVGFEVTSRFSDGVIEVEFPIEPTEEAMAAMAERARRAEARSVARILAPRSVAVIGASRRPDSLGQAVFRRLLQGEFDGAIYPVNPEADVVASVRAHPTILDVPDEIDLAVVVVPAEQVAEVVEQCGRKRVQGLVVISAGFAETGTEGARREAALVEQARRLGIRLIGPNSMGVLNTAPDVRLLATFADVHPRPGRVAVSSQSGTIGAAVLRRLDQLGVGVSSFVATGNKADVSGNDLLQYWETDDATDVVVLYLESFGNPRNFARIARRMGRTKPIVAVKAGSALAARRPDRGVDGAGDGFAGPTRAGSHAGRISERVSDALLAQTGVIRVDTLEQLFDVSRVLVDQPLPAGRRVAVLSNFWGPAVLATDACVAAGLELATPDPAIQRGLTPELLSGTRLGNPLELTSDAGPRELTVAARGLLADPGVDALLVLHAPSLDGGVELMARALSAVADESPKPVVASFLGSVLPGDQPAGRVPVFTFPETAAQALGRVARYAEWRARQTGTIPVVQGVDDDAAQEVAARLLGDDPVPGVRRVVDLADAVALLATVGIEPVDQRAVRSADEAVAAAEAVGWPVALKALGVDRPSRTEAGGVAVDIFDEADLRRSYDRMAAHHGPAMDTTLVQHMAPYGVDCRIDVLQHPVMGSVLGLGPSLGGRPQQRILPLTDDDAAALVERGPMAEELTALAPSGRAALVDLLLRLSALADAVPQVADLRLAPVIVSDARAAITDIRLGLAPWDTESSVRRLG
ncbi:GNAT family N-acetyltransferase [Iamia sp.]|uniref:bifunctional acetate--CoA ligase family protein/GNAT family N-acetyltransferase n=1 Tax=Iamia sp. TaxID=2722710 RepID=UPI002D02ABBF|nr:GNAT family N-acetyltransferase [Iamia sp.]HXH56854.1 GNAT family N-acetyltransferase [Iamia sp.]